MTADPEIKKYEAVRDQCRAMAKDDPKGAYLNFQSSVMGFAAFPGIDAVWSDACRTLVELMGPLAKGKIEDSLGRVRANPQDGKALYDLAYECFEVGQHGVAATLLAKAYRLSPGSAKIMTELISNLDEMGRHGDACRVLRESGLVEKDYFCRYLLAFHLVMVGDLAGAEKIPLVLSEAPENLRWPTEQVRHMLDRARAVKGIAPLDEWDLRGWHYVINGGLLLHLSPHGFKDAMRGRYAFVQDSYELCREGVDKVVRLAKLWNLSGKVWSHPDRGSEILGRALGAALGWPLAPWPPKPTEEPGIFVVYDMERLTQDTFEAVENRAPGQLLWSHATNWTASAPFAADLVTFLHQSNQEPWGERLVVNPETKKAELAEPSQEDDEKLSIAILAAKAEPETGDIPPDRLDLEPLARAILANAGKDFAGPLAPPAPRPRFRQGSPVPSNRFF